MTISDKNMNYKIIDKQTYYRSGVFRHFSEDCKCSTSMTARINVTARLSMQYLPPAGLNSNPTEAAWDY